MYIENVQDLVHHKDAIYMTIANTEFHCSGTYTIPYSRVFRDVFKLQNIENAEIVSCIIFYIAKND